MTEHLFATGRCFACGRLFAFDPKLVPSVLVDPANERPIDIDKEWKMIVPTAEAYANAVKMPLCGECVELANELRAKVGREPISVPPGSYPFGP